eukprot:1599982-Rhodomonas_salina.1
MCIRDRCAVRDPAAKPARGARAPLLTRVCYGYAAIAVPCATRSAVLSWAVCSHALRDVRY